MLKLILPRVISNDFFNPVVGSRLLNCTKIQYAYICSKENRDPDYKRPPPFPYETKKFTPLHCYFDFATKRFDENTKLIVVDGNIGAGKSALAKELAEAFDMVYFPEPTMERYFISDYGFDIRKIDELLPPSFKCCDVSTYYSNPHHQNVPRFQLRMFMFRLDQYIDALAHILNTGQGVVLERSVYGDFVFAEAMHKFGYMRSAALQLYKDIRKNTTEELMRPHLIVYLDISPEVALERIRKRNNPSEVNSKVLTKEYLKTIDYLYKQEYLKEMEKHCELLIYDWNNYGDTEVVVEDIEKIDFDRFTPYEKKLKDWRKYDQLEWNWARRFYTMNKDKILNYGMIYRPYVEEFFHPREDCNIFNDIMRKIPGEKYEPGFNPDAGDNVWFKTTHEKGFRYSGIQRMSRE